MSRSCPFWQRGAGLFKRLLFRAFLASCPSDANTDRLVKLGLQLARVVFAPPNHPDCPGDLAHGLALERDHCEGPTRLELGRHTRFFGALAIGQLFSSTLL